MKSPVLRRGIGAIAFLQANYSTSSSFTFSDKKIAPPDVRLELNRIRLIENELRERWVGDEENWRKLPSRSWPEHQPSADQIPYFRKQYLDKCCHGQYKSEECDDITFNLATALLFNHVNPQEGFELYLNLANRGCNRGKTAAGICYVEGLGVESDEEKGSTLLQDAARADFLQAIYELGVLCYNGNATPYIKEDVEEAFRLFELAASQEHSCGLFMTADMLLSGEGCNNIDVARAIRLLYKAGERGHRNARATLWKLLSEYE